MGLVDKLKDALGLGETETEISWADRIGEAAYTPPSGLKITFDFEDLQYRATKKATAWNFPGVNGTYVQDHGVEGRRFPMRIFLWGADCDKMASVFEAALFEKGIGTLTHPMYGEHDVVWVGELIRRDDLKTAANQVIFEVEFFKTVGSAYPLGFEEPATAVLAAIEAFGNAATAEFATSLDQGSISEKKDFLDTLNDAIDEVGDQLDKIAKVQDVINDQFEDITDTINNAIDTFVSEPLMLAYNTKLLIQAPARALASITARLEGYSNLADSIFSAPDAVSSPGGPGGQGPRIDSATGVGNDAQEPNRFHTRNLVASLAVSGSVLSTIFTSTETGGAAAVPAVGKQRADAIRTGSVDAGSKFTTASEVFLAVDSLLDQLDDLVTWQDLNYQSISGGNLTPAEIEDFISAPSNTDAGGAIQHLKQAVSLAAGYLIELSFSLQQERVIVLDRPRSIVDLVAELYGSVDDQLDDFIDVNSLTGSEILELPRGRSIRYYV